MTTDTNPHGLTGAYVLDALEPFERIAFEDHLDTCPECREEVAGLREAAADLAALTRVPAPAALRRRVLDGVARTPQVGRVDHAARLDRAAQAVAGARPGTAPDDDAHPRRPTAWQRWWAAAAAVLVLVVGGAVGGTIAVRQHRADEATAAAQAHMMLIATAPDAVSHAVPLGTSHVVMSGAMQAAALVGEDVPMPANPGMTYQLWMVHADGTTAPGPTFVPDRGRVLTFVEGDLGKVTELTVTEEPMGGSRAPTGDVVATVAL